MTGYKSPNNMKKFPNSWQTAVICCVCSIFVVTCVLDTIPNIVSVMRLVAPIVACYDAIIYINLRLLFESSCDSISGSTDPMFEVPICLTLPEVSHISYISYICVFLTPYLLQLPFKH